MANVQGEIFSGDVRAWGQVGQKITDAGIDHWQIN